MTPALGFASNLSHTIIKEMQEDDARSNISTKTDSTNISITDEELALLGAPWAKEGMLCRKQYSEFSGKRAKDRSWMDVFVVIQKGGLNMFTFGEHANGASGVVGGGNWLVSCRLLLLLSFMPEFSIRAVPNQWDRYILPTRWLMLCPLLVTTGYVHIAWCSLSLMVECISSKPGLKNL
jgi:hypothetical protein